MKVYFEKDGKEVEAKAWTPTPADLKDAGIDQDAGSLSANIGGGRIFFSGFGFSCRSFEVLRYDRPDFRVTNQLSCFDFFGSRMCVPVPVAQTRTCTTVLSVSYCVFGTLPDATWAKVGDCARRLAPRIVPWPIGTGVDLFPLEDRLRVAIQACAGLPTDPTSHAGLYWTTTCTPWA